MSAVVRAAALSVVLLALAPAAAAQPPQGVLTNTNHGAALYAANCLSCHGANGKGVAPPGFPGAGGCSGWDRR
jgi:mono/diheme cytochrome c family protein